ncbi:MAG: endonuclease III [Candidatus Bathyarchaeota archaeon]|nr:endonuclease III [Candidatus Bathyarchaeota archaeon]MCZ2845486.1 endonuclease III [Candidatus Bathyarchaeota archaeon]
MNARQIKKTALGEMSKKHTPDPFKILIGTILSHRTRDSNTEKAVNQLFTVYKNVHELANGKVSIIEKLIKPANFYRIKANRIKEVSKIIINEYNGKVPNNLDQLLSLPSVGRKTANCVLVYGFNKPAIPVDTHVHRISNRLGIVKTKKPEETEIVLTKLLDQKYWLEINEFFVKFGQTICRPVNPKCGVCKLNKTCSYFLVMNK